MLSLNIRYFVALLGFVAICALFGNLWPKKCLFRSKTNAFIAKIVNTCLTKAFMAIFAKINRSKFMRLVNWIISSGLLKRVFPKLGFIFFNLSFGAMAIA